MNRILVGVDFSEPSRTALSKAVELTKGSHGKVLALHIAESSLIESLVQFSHLDRDEVIDDLELRLSRFASELQADSSVIETKLIVGHPVKDFASEADSFDPDLLVLGAWGSHGLSPDHVGLTAKQIIQECRCDTLLTRRPNPLASGVVACIDFSPYDMPVITTARSLARLEGEPFGILHVFYPPWKMEGASSKAESVLDADFAQEYNALLQGRIENFLVEEGISDTEVSTTALECLNHPEGILSHLREVHAEIVVLGARGSSRIESMILGRIAERIVIGSETSVYIVKTPG